MLQDKMVFNILSSKNFPTTFKATSPKKCSVKTNDN